MKLITLKKYCDDKNIPYRLVSDPSIVTKSSDGNFVHNHDVDMLITVIDDVVINDDYFAPLVGDSEFCLFDQTYYPLPDIYKKENLKSEVEYYNESMIILGGSNNYYHNLLNWIPRLKLIQEFDGFDGCRVLIGSRLSDHALSVISRYSGMPISNFVRRSYDKRTVVAKAIVSSFIQNPVHSPYAINFIRSHASKKRSFRKEFKKRIFISRKDAIPRRQIVNEDELFSELKSVGFEVYELSSLSLDDQVALFKNAEIIVSPHGAGLANLLFCTEKPYVIELQSKQAFTRVYWSLSCLVGNAGYDIVKCEEVDIDTEDRISNDRDIIAPISQVLDLINRL